MKQIVHERIGHIATNGLIVKTECKQFYGDNIEVTISRQIFDLRNEISQIRREFHRHPELSLKEFETI